MSRSSRMGSFSAVAVMVASSFLVALPALAPTAGAQLPQAGPSIALSGVYVLGNAIGKYFVTTPYLIHTDLTVKNTGSPWPSGDGFFILAAEGEPSNLSTGTAVPLTCQQVDTAPSASGINVSFNFSPLATPGPDVPITIVVNPNASYGGTRMCAESSPYPIQQQTLTGRVQYEQQATTVHFAVNELPDLEFRAHSENWCVADSWGNNKSSCTPPANPTSTSAGKVYFNATLTNVGSYEKGGTMLTVPPQSNYNRTDNSATSNALFGTPLPVPVRILVHHNETDSLTYLSNTWENETKTSLTTNWTKPVTSCGTTSAAPAPASGTECSNMLLAGAAGNYTVTFTADPNGTLPTLTPHDPLASETATFQVGAQELNAHIGILVNPQTSTLHGIPVLPQNGTFNLNISVWNNGSIDTTGTEQWQLGLVEPYGGAGPFQLLSSGTLGVIKAHSGQALYIRPTASFRNATPKNYNWTVPYSSSISSPNYVAGGNKTIEFVVDQQSNAPPWSDTTESPDALPCGPIGTNTQNVNGRNMTACGAQSSVANVNAIVKETQPPTVLAPTHWALFNYQNDTNTWTAFPTTGRAIVRENQPLNVSIYATDDDTQMYACSSCVQVKLSHEGAVVKTINLVGHQPAITGGYWLFNATFANVTPAPGNWTMQLAVQDPVGNLAPSLPSPVTFTVLPWPIQTLLFNSTDCHESCPASTTQGWLWKPLHFDQVGTTNDLEFRVFITSMETGIADGTTCSQGQGPAIQKWITIIEPTAAGSTGPTYLTNSAGTPVHNFPLRDELSCSGGNPGGLQQTPETTPEIFSFADGDAGLHYGLWRSAIIIQDRAGFNRTVWWNFTVTDNPTVTAAFTNLPQNGQVNAQQSFPLTLTTTDNNTVSAAWAEIIHRNTTAHVDFRENISLPKAGMGCSSSPPLEQCIFSAQMTTGFGGTAPYSLPLAGMYVIKGIYQEGDGAQLFCTQMNASYACPYAYINVTDDGQPPTISVADNGVRQWLTGKPLRWEGKATDDTNWTPYLTLEELSPTPSTILDHVMLNASAKGCPTGDWCLNYTFTPEQVGNYQWWLEFADSAGHQSISQTQPLAIRQNTAPIFSAITPDPSLLKVSPNSTNFSDLGTYWSNDRPHAVIQVIDLDGISLKSIQVWAPDPSTGNMTNVTSLCQPNSAACWIAPTSDSLGYIITYNWTDTSGGATENLSHRGTYALHIRATDMSQTRVPEMAWGNMSFDIVSTPPSSQAPEFSPKYAGPGSTLENVSYSTTFKIGATDQVYPDGVAGTYYRTVQVATGVTSNWTLEKPVGFTLQTYRGLVEIDYYSVDKVGNSEYVAGSLPYHVLDVFLDGYPPYFPTQIQGEDYLITDHWANFTITDVGSGVQSATMFFKVNNGDWQNESMSYNATQNKWTAKFPDLFKGDVVSLYLRAIDNLGNVGQLGNATTPATQPFKIGNAAPYLNLLSPTSHSVVSGTILFKWSSGDVDGDKITLRLIYRSTADQNWHELFNTSDTNSSYPFDTTSLLDGPYEFEMIASDGQAPTSVSAILTIANEGPALVPLPPATTPSAGDTIVLQVQGKKPENEIQSVFATAYLNGVKLPGVITFYDDGNLATHGDAVKGDNLWSTKFVTSAPGTYHFDVTLIYSEQGVNKQDTRPMSFSVQTSSSYIVSSNPALVGGVVVAAIAAVGVGAWGALRKR
ncbi:MAG: choice-of-anchor X domain-containing protein [Thermoplasmatota archaeon]